MEESQEDLDPFSPKKLGKQETTKVPRFEKLSLMLLKPSCRLCKSDSSSWGSHCKPDRWFPLLLRRYSVVSRYQITNSPPRLLALWRSNWSLTGRTWNALPLLMLVSGQASIQLLPYRQGWTLTNLWYVYNLSSAQPFTLLPRVSISWTPSNQHCSRN